MRGEVPVKIAIPECTEGILRRLTSAGHAAYAVGGCVRDSCLGFAPHDWDICTSALPEETERCFIDLRVVETGVKHGTVTVIFEGESFEITTFRVESGYADFRRPDRVQFVRELEADLSRRDFTINAMAAAADGAVIDPFGGREDLRRGLIRCVGEPGLRFHEDALRILRALRFAARLGFEIEPQTAAALHEASPLLAHVSAERCASELRALVICRCGRLLVDYADVLAVVLPELGAVSDNPAWRAAALAVDNAPADEIVRLALVFAALGSEETARRRLCALRFDNRTASAVCELVRCAGRELTPERLCLRRLLAELGEAQARRLVALRRALGDTPELASCDSALAALISEDGCPDVRGLAIGGRELMALGIAPGRELGALLTRLHELVVDEEVKNNRAALLERAAEIIGAGR